MEKSHLQTVMAMRQVDREGERDDGPLVFARKGKSRSAEMELSCPSFFKIKKVSSQLAIFGRRTFFTGPVLF